MIAFYLSLSKIRSIVYTRSTAVDVTKYINVEYRNSLCIIVLELNSFIKKKKHLVEIDK